MDEPIIDLQPEDAVWEEDMEVTSVPDDTMVEDAVIVDDSAEPESSNPDVVPDGDGPAPDSQRDDDLNVDPGEEPTDVQEATVVDDDNPIEDPVSQAHDEPVPDDGSLFTSNIPKGPTYTPWSTTKVKPDFFPLGVSTSEGIRLDDIQEEEPSVVDLSEEDETHDATVQSDLVGAREEGTLAPTIQSEPDDEPHHTGGIPCLPKGVRPPLITGRNPEVILGTGTEPFAIIDNYDPEPDIDDPGTAVTPPQPSGITPPPPPVVGHPENDPVQGWDGPFITEPSQPAEHAPSVDSQVVSHKLAGATSGRSGADAAYYKPKVVPWGWWASAIVAALVLAGAAGLWWWKSQQPAVDTTTAQQQAAPVAPGGETGPALPLHQPGVAFTDVTAQDVVLGVTVDPSLNTVVTSAGWTVGVSAETVLTPKTPEGCSLSEPEALCHLANSDGGLLGGHVEWFAVKNLVDSPMFGHKQVSVPVPVNGAAGVFTTVSRNNGNESPVLLVGLPDRSGLVVSLPAEVTEAQATAFAGGLTITPPQQ